MHKVFTHPVQEDFTYLEFEGDMDEVYHHRRDEFMDVYTPFHEPKQEVMVSLDKLIYWKFSY